MGEGGAVSLLRALFAWFVRWLPDDKNQEEERDENEQTDD